MCWSRDDRGWIVKRYNFVPSTSEPYQRVLELYCLHVLPRNLGQWEYVKEFRLYENEFSSDKKMNFIWLSRRNTVTP
ncbi:hypothetical protein BD769DRAFT_1021016 [Suillus cothurnatus]|nr:hypothetical protein BD769DRAFT_1021016 [Suillus cothurnatus]